MVSVHPTSQSLVFEVKIHDWLDAPVGCQVDYGALHDVRTTSDAGRKVL